MDAKNLERILREHKKGINNQEDGERADLQCADLLYANLRYANLHNTILDGINWLSYIGITTNKQGKGLGYKLVTFEGEGIFQGGINYLDGDKFQVPKVDPDAYTQCSYGINLATFQWCLNNKNNESNRLLLFEFNVKDTVCPIASDGKFRVKKCTKIGECDWKGNLLKEGKQ